MKYIIFANGDINNYSFIKQYLDDSLIICCDGGVRHTKNMDIMPNFIVGDFDSADKDILEYYKKNSIPLITFPKEKDFTDLELCFNIAIEQKATEILVFGGIGNRFDHTLTNAHVLMLALKNNIKAKIINENNIIQLIDDEIILKGKRGSIVSLIPLSTEVTGVITDGLFYKLNCETLYIGQSRGVSNLILDEQASVKIQSGFLFVIQVFEQIK